ncbi:hypothetical protein [Nakamurella endophytica]|uniref:Beta-lactamase family protein n=1 Tax=Nakamurella endophytica TaxID=1748367 RepID=A0A917TB98_9ACTN|nr:hypothetical protein [Nakamurella endophytica]GGM16827.1 hypothetical protein GCM10011594_41090 [Nakamurella endophytica]
MRVRRWAAVVAVTVALAAALVVLVQLTRDGAAPTDGIHGTDAAGTGAAAPPVPPASRAGTVTVPRLGSGASASRVPSTAVPTPAPTTPSSPAPDTGGSPAGTSSRADPSAVGPGATPPSVPPADPTSAPTSAPSSDPSTVPTAAAAPSTTPGSAVAGPTGSSTPGGAGDGTSAPDPHGDLAGPTLTTAAAWPTLQPGRILDDRSADDVARDVLDAVDEAADLGVRQHVAVLDRSTGDVVAAVGQDDQVPSMSLVKLFIATDVLSRAGGVTQLDADTEQRLWTMITRSDDGIAQDFWDADGGPEIVQRTAVRYGLADTEAPSDRYWGDVQVTAADLASFLDQALQQTGVGPWLTSAMLSAADTGDDGFDQDFGMNAVTGAGSKQGWGCCLSGVLALHSVGFTADRIVVVLSTAEPDAPSEDLQTADDLSDDPGARTSIAAVTRTVAAAVGS